MATGVTLRDYQLDAVANMRNGCILNGDVGTGKSRTSIGYYYILNGGEVNTKEYKPMKHRPKNLYIITTAKKRDSLEWEEELMVYKMHTDPTYSRYDHKIVIDSWNNISKYADVKDSFFIFDEQRVIGYGAWTKSFLKIAKSNEWILLSATPGDTWADYIPVFIANGFYKNKSEFERIHAVFSRYSKFPKIEKWINEGRLISYKKRLLIEMKMTRDTVRHNETVMVEYDRKLYNKVSTDRWDPFKNEPILNASQFCYILRKIVNSDPSRLLATLEIVKKHPRAIIFYSYNYELELLRSIFSREYRINVLNKEQKDFMPTGVDQWLYLVDEDYLMAEWNGHKHQTVPKGDSWVYLVEYLAGSEGWNCITTDTIIFYSQNYSYRVMHQASGRIDRMNTKYKDLYYYHLRSNSKIDVAIKQSLTRKKKFNERGFAPAFIDINTIKEKMGDNV